MVLGQNYYSMGPLQGYDRIEKWVFTDDRYDRNRMEVSNEFRTEEKLRL